MNPSCWNLIVKTTFPIYLLAVGCFLYELGTITQCSIHVVWRFNAVGRQAVPWGVSLSCLPACFFPGECSIFICVGFVLTTCTANAREREAGAGICMLMFTPPSKRSNPRLSWAAPRIKASRGFHQLGQWRQHVYPPLLSQRLNWGAEVQPFLHWESLSPSPCGNKGDPPWEGSICSSSSRDKS